MKCLAIDTTTDISSIALVDEAGVLGEYNFAHQMDLSRRLMPNIVSLLKDCGLRVRDLEAIGVSLGPGSFTGLRIGVVTAKILAHVLRIPIAGVVSLDLLAEQFSYLEQHIICPLIRVRKGEVYHAFYQTCRGKIERMSNYEASPIQHVIESSREILSSTSSAKSEPEQRLIFCGDGLPDNIETLTHALGEIAVFAPSWLSYPKASLIGAIALERIRTGKADDAMSLVPFYIRRSAPEVRMESAQTPN
jgi:tRNA threonylcarbamoyladenosine biosynthesis protein TsaB